MGDFNVRLVKNQKELNEFTKCLLNDVLALKKEMIHETRVIPTEAREHLGAPCRRQH